MRCPSRCPFRCPSRCPSLCPRSLPRIDSSPDDGTVCKDPVTHKYPKSQKVCGLCGILSDSSYPTGAFVV